MAELKDILKGIPGIKVSGNQDIEVSGVTADSREVSTGFLFAAIRGTITDGHKYITNAISSGATAVLTEELPEEKPEGITFILSGSSSKTFGEISHRFFGEPTRKMELIGITGTNGKTTTTSLLYNVFRSLGYKTGLISTIEILIDGEKTETRHTTPDPVNLNRTLARMVEKGVSHVFMEVSSHAIEQNRVAGLNFAGAAFTNISHDHLDYHHTFDNYIAAKKKLFDNLPKDSFALTNIDDKRGMVMVQNTKARVLTYSLKKLADYKAKILENDFIGMRLHLNNREIFTRLTGEFNAYNLLCAYAIARELGESDEKTLQVLSLQQGPAGRFEIVRSGENITGIVDYAHTPDALKNVLTNIAGINNTRGNLITVIGCGGNRDKAKRPEMAKIACHFSDQVILTSDNPRDEDPGVIISEMEAGLNIHEKRKTLSITDRDQAIKTACRLAGKGDIILVAGKGHEKYQEIKGEKFPFDDKDKLTQYLGTE